LNIHVEELTPEEIELLNKRSRLKAQLRGDCKAAHEGKVICTYCRAELSQSRTYLSHIVPPAHGGTTDAKNVVLSCRSCCDSKDCRTLPEWIERLNDQLDGVHALMTAQASKTETEAA